MKKNKILSIIIATFAISYGLSGISNTVGAMQNNSKVNSKGVSDRTKNMFTYTLNISILHVLQNMNVSINEYGLFEFNYEKPSFWKGQTVIDTSELHKLTIENENDVPELAKKIINIILSGLVSWQSSDGIVQKIDRFLGSVDKYSDLVDQWKEQNVFDSKIQEIINSNDVINRLKGKIKEAKKNTKTNNKK